MNNDRGRRDIVSKLAEASALLEQYPPETKLCVFCGKPICRCWPQIKQTRIDRQVEIAVRISKWIAV